MPRSCYVIMVLGDGAPVLLGPMSPDVRTDVMRDLQGRYGPTSGLHALDIESGGPGRVSVIVKSYEPEGEQA